MPDATNGSRGLVPAVTSLADYQRQQGFVALQRTRERGDGSDILRTIRQSGLRGHGGAGMPTADKLQAVVDAVAARGGPPFLVVNAYDADPQSLIAQTILSRQPFLALEGLVLAALAVGAREAYLYVHATNQAGYAAVNSALQQMHDGNLLNGLAVSIVGVDVGFMGGEESTMLEVIKGRRAMAVQRPPFPAQAGLGEIPTAVLNLETATQLVAIMLGGQSYKQNGNASPGTKLVTVYGTAEQGTLVEVPFGTTIAAICQQADVSTEGARAIVVGGPEGGVLPPDRWNTPFDFEPLKAVGTIVGSGTINVLPAKTCLVAWAKSRMAYLARESCGKCIPCRVGTKRMEGVLEGVMSDIGVAKDLEVLTEFSTYIPNGSLCGFGWNATHAIETAMRYFGDDFQRHLAGECPTGTCMPVRSHRFATKKVL